MRSVVVFQNNVPTTSATNSREAVTTGGQNDVYVTSITTRGRLRKKSGFRGLDLGFIAGEDSFELLVRYQSGLEYPTIRIGGKVLVDGHRYTIQSWEKHDQLNHIVRFNLNIQIGS